MANTTTTAAKTEVKTEARTEAKDATATNAGSGKETESSTSDAPTGYSRGENQKPVTEAIYSARSLAADRRNKAMPSEKRSHSGDDVAAFGTPSQRW